MRVCPSPSCLLLLFLLAGICCSGSSQDKPTKGAVDLPSSENIVQLTPELAEEETNDGRVWFVEFYTPGCIGCKRIVHHVVETADTLAETDPDIVVARINCEEFEAFCFKVNIPRTPCFKIFFEGKDQFTYTPDFYLAETMLPFFRKMRAQMLGLPLPEGGDTAPDLNEPSDSEFDFDGEAEGGFGGDDEEGEDEEGFEEGDDMGSGYGEEEEGKEQDDDQYSDGEQEVDPALGDPYGIYGDQETDEEDPYLDPDEGEEGEEGGKEEAHRVEEL